MRVCPSCNAMVADDANYCAKCGRSTSVDPTTTPRPPMGSDSLTAFLRGTTTDLRIVGGCTFVVFIALLLPWYSVSFLGVSASLNGFHGWGWITFVGLIAGVLATVELGGLRRATASVPRPERRVRLVPLLAGVVEAVGAIGYLADIASSTHGIGSPSVGLYLALIAGLVTAAVGAWPMLSGARRRPGGPRP